MAWTPDPPNPGDTNHVLRTPLPLAVLDPRTQQLTAANTAFTSLLGLDASNVAGLDLFSFVLENDRKLIECLLAGAASGQIYSAQGRGSWRRADGGTVHVIAWVHPLDAPQGTGDPRAFSWGPCPPTARLAGQWLSPASTPRRSPSG